MKQTMTLDSEKLRLAMRTWASGVTIVTASFENEQHGMTVNSFTSVAMEPPLISISLQSESRTFALVSKSNAFAVTILEENQLEISDRFAGRLPDSEDQWIGIETETLITGAPLIKGGLAYFDCRVTKAIPVGSNTLFLAEVIATRENPNGQPLLYYNRNYQNLVKLQRP
ncbi:MAG: flavin reductase family protein [Anaerolineae bacterium]|nr:flavin reductase family protein [Anaerolineae bacterium]